MLIVTISIILSRRLSRFSWTHVTFQHKMDNIFIKILTNYCSINFQKHILFYVTRSSRPEVLCKRKVFLKISENSQENICASDSF